MFSMAPVLHATGQVIRGQQLYESRCIGCHSMNADRIGPRHAGLIGRRAGSVSGFAYSAALANAPLIWNAQTLEQWLRDPEGLVPGQAMNIRVANAQDRADLIAFLIQYSVPTGK